MKSFFVLILIFVTFKCYTQCSINTSYYVDQNWLQGQSGFINPSREDDKTILKLGTKFKITASGILSFHFSRSWTATPDGGECLTDSGYTYGENDFLYPELPCWSLLAQIGNGKVFLVGSNYEGVAEESGEFKIFINTRQSLGYSGTEGSWHVELREADEQACPLFFAGYNMARTVDDNNGHVQFNMKNCIVQYSGDEYSAIGGGLYFQATTPGGHQFLAINPLGTSNLNVLDLINILESHIGKIFPGGAKDYSVPGSTPYNTTLIKNHIYSLVSNKWWNIFYYPRVVCTDISTFHFTFLATSHHLFKGTAIHGIFQDKCGDFYMFQQGQGPEDEGLYHQGANKKGAYFMWLSMAENMREFLLYGHVLSTPL